MSSEEFQEIQEIQENNTEIQANQENNPEIQENQINNPEIQENEDIAVPKRGRGRPRGSKNKVKIMVVDTDIPAVTLSAPTENEEAAVTIAEEPTKKEAAPIPKKPRATKRAQPDSIPERRVCSTENPMAMMMLSFQELQKQRMATKRAMYRNMIA